MLTTLNDFFAATAWPMDTVVPYSFFHIALTLGGILLAAFLARFFANAKRPAAGIVLFSCGLLLAVSEVYKQGFLYTIVYDHHYGWWFFPFQLCSIPMYLCLAYPFLGTGSPSQKTAATFIQDFGLLGGMMALAVPDGFLHPYWTLTLHGFFWHFLLLFLGLYCGQRGLTDDTGRGFLKTLPLYLACCAIATMINIFVQSTVYPADYADLFYINCAFPSEQPVFRQISLRLGNVWGHLAYLLASCAGAGLIHRVCRQVWGRA